MGDYASTKNMLQEIVATDLSEIYKRDEELPLLLLYEYPLVILRNSNSGY